MTGSTIRLTMAQALVRWLTQQFTEIEGVRVPLFAGVFAIFGHGNVTCLSEALEAVQDRLPTWRGQNEQSMALAAIAFAKAKRRRQIMIAATSIGPGALNMVTAAGTAHANRLPVLLVSGDTLHQPAAGPGAAAGRAFRRSDRHGQRRLQGRDALLGPHHASRADHLVAAAGGRRDARSGRLRPGVPGVAAGHAGSRLRLSGGLLRGARCGPSRGRVRIGPSSLEAAALLKTAKKPLLIAGGGVRYSLAEKVVGEFAVKHGVPIVETIAGKGGLTHDHPAHAGPIGIIGSTSANALASEADVILAVGTRLQDFTTGSWTSFNPDARFISINAARFDAVKHRALAVVGDARETVTELDAELGAWRADPAHLAHAQGAVQGMGRAARRASGAEQRARPDLRASRPAP